MTDSKRTFLTRYRHNNALISILEKRIAAMDERINTMRSPDLTGMPRGGTGKSNFDLIDAKCDLEARMSDLVALGKVYKKEITEKIDTLEDTRYIGVLELYCLDCLAFGDIASMLCYSERHIKRLYAEAVEAIDI